jgi:hypothetical protein
MRASTVAAFRGGEPVTGYIGAHPVCAIGTFLIDAGVGRN